LPKVLEVLEYQHWMIDGMTKMN